VSRAGVDAGGLPVGMALREVGVTTTVVVVAGAIGIWDLRLVEGGRVATRAGGLATEMAGVAVVGGLVTTGGEVTGAAVAGGGVT
jgi:hypothetical protein